jgi:hypothetical protein
VLATRTPKNAFFEFFLREVSTTPPPARPIYPRGGDPSPSAPGTMAHDRPHQVDQDCAGCWMAGSVSDRARPNGQNYCKQKCLFFMCKPLDKRNKIVYNIDSKQTYLHHHKTGGQNHEKDR